MIGFLVVLLASIFFCFQNVTVRVLFSQHTVLGFLQTGGFVTPTLQHSFLLLAMRMALVVPLTTCMIPTLYPDTWKDLRQLANGKNWDALGRSLTGGGLMFLYLALFYIAVGLLPTGIAITLFFTYPVFTGLLSKYWFGTFPNRFQWSVMGLVLIGSFLTIPQGSSPAEQPSWLGVGVGIASGLAYALYAVNAQRSFETTHPVPFTWISFATTWVLAIMSLWIWHVLFSPLQTVQLDWSGLWVGALLSAIATATGHLLNNFGIRLIGATTAAMVGASNPALTVILAWFLIQEKLNYLQLVGVAIVSLSVALLSRSHQAR